MGNIKFHGSIPVLPFKSKGFTGNDFFRDIHHDWFRTGIPEGVHKAMLDLLHGGISFEVFAKRYLGYYRIFEAKKNIETGDINAALYALLNLWGMSVGPDAMTKDNYSEFVDALWEVLQQDDWNQRNIREVTAYFSRSIRRRRNRAEVKHITPKTKQKPMDIFPTAEEVVHYRELVKQIRELRVTRTQRKIADFLIDEESRGEIANLLNISRENLRQQLNLLKKSAQKIRK
jgi:hypothetical protein